MGSGGRAATLLTEIMSSSIEWGPFTFYPSAHRLELQALEALGVRVIATETTERYAFSYFHPLSVPARYPGGTANASEMRKFVIEGDVVLRFSMVEGDARVTARTAIYDPQGAYPYSPYCENGSKSERLALVLNEHEVMNATGEVDIRAAANKLISDERASVVVVKRGAKGVMVLDANGSVVNVPPYVSKRVFKIGSGDVFSAAFSFYWGQQNMDC